METKYIKEFVALAETCNYHDTADKMFISPSSLSKHIARIESELGVDLFDRTTRSVELTQYGVLFCKYAQKITELCDEYDNIINEFRIRKESHLSIGLMPRFGQYGILELLSDFSQSHPHISIHMTEYGEPKEFVCSKKCDFAFDIQIENTPLDNDLKKILYGVDNLVAVFPAKHPLAKEEYVTIEQLRDQDFIMHGESVGSSYIASRIFRQHCIAAGFKPQEIMSIMSTSNMVKLVSKEKGVAIMHRVHALANMDSGISIVDIHPFITFKVYLLYLQHQKLSPAASEFIRYIGMHSH